MNPIAAFLARYKQLRPPSEAVAAALIEAVEKIVGVRIDQKDVRISRSTAFIAGSSTLKSEIALRRKDILTLTGELGGKLEDIR